MWCETTFGTLPFMSFVEKTHLHQRLHLPKHFTIKQPVVQAGLVAFYLKEYLAFVHVKSNSSLDNMSSPSKSLVFTIEVFVVVVNLLFNGQ